MDSRMRENDKLGGATECLKGYSWQKQKAQISVETYYFTKTGK